LISWRSTRYEVVGHTKDGKEKKASKLEYHKTPLLAFTNYLKLRLKKYVTHNYMAGYMVLRTIE